MRRRGLLVLVLLLAGQPGCGPSWNLHAIGASKDGSATVRVWAACGTDCSTRIDLEKDGSVKTLFRDGTDRYPGLTEIAWASGGASFVIFIADYPDRKLLAAFEAGSGRMLDPSPFIRLLEAGIRRRHGLPNDLGGVGGAFRWASSHDGWARYRAVIATYPFLNIPVLEAPKPIRSVR